MKSYSKTDQSKHCTQQTAHRFHAQNCRGTGNFIATIFGHETHTRKLYDHMVCPQLPTCNSVVLHPRLRSVSNLYILTASAMFIECRSKNRFIHQSPENTLMVPNLCNLYSTLFNLNSNHTVTTNYGQTLLLKKKHVKLYHFGYRIS